MKPKLTYPLMLAVAVALAAGALAQAGRAPSPERGGELLTDLERYRLWAAREAALKRQDARAIEKLAEISRRVGTSTVWSSEHNAELHKLLEQLEARLGVTPAPAAPPRLKPEDYPFAVPRRELLNVRFANAEGADANLQSLDVHAPATGDRHPIIVWLHGGGMKGGDKAQAGINVLKPDFFLARGYVFASVNYRLAPEQKHPAQAEDTAAAPAWLHDHAAKFGGDPGRIFIIGISAGAQLAVVVSTNERLLARHQKSLGIVKGAVILDIGSFDIPTLMERAGEKAPEMYRYTFRAGGTREDWIDCSPLYPVGRAKGIPPMLLYYVAGRDHHAAENQRFAERMKAEGCKATVLAAEGKTHLRIELEIGTTGDAHTAEILKFLDQQIRCADMSLPRRWGRSGLWISTYENEGPGALRSAKRGRKKGSSRNLTLAQEKEIQKVITDKAPDQLKMPFALWTRRAVCDLVVKRYGARLPERVASYFHLL